MHTASASNLQNGNVDQCLIYPCHWSWTRSANRLDRKSEEHEDYRLAISRRQGKQRASAADERHGVTPLNRIRSEPPKSFTMERDHLSEKLQSHRSYHHEVMALASFKAA
jgi:superfamily I DNA and/or RNA helicase